MIYTYNLTGEIKTGESEKFNNFLNDVNERGEGEIRVVINSQGGSVTEGLALYDAISACKTRLKQKSSVYVLPLQPTLLAVLIAAK